VALLEDSPLYRPIYPLYPEVFAMGREGACNLDEVQTKRGRPRKYGLQSIAMLERTALVLFAYDRSRHSRNKHSIAIADAVSYVRQHNPAMPICETEVKRILARWRSKLSKFTLLVTSPPADSNPTILPNGKVERVNYRASWGLRPIYPRINSRQLQS
jgi:hypothetical protein